MPEIFIRRDGFAGRVTLNRPEALNALTYEMCLAIEKAFDAWREDPEVRLAIIEGEGERAFCSGGDIAEMYRTGTAGDYEYGRRFWSDEYRLNAKISEWPKPVVSFLHGYTMGGGVGVGCHGTHRIVCENSRIAMPECGIGLVPDVGGSLILARAPGRLGEYLASTAAHMGPADALLAGFADVFVPRENWLGIKRNLTESGDTGRIAQFAAHAPPGRLDKVRECVDDIFAKKDIGEIVEALKYRSTETCARILESIRRNSPLSVAVAVALVRLQRSSSTLREALRLEYRFTSRAAEHGDFLEGIRAKIIDKDGTPKWRHRAAEEVPAEDVARMLAPLSDSSLELEFER
ncbi:MAG: enoyl-CoA hydratase/isomerase family protein [Albidovulum sp.]|nr:enoyl-CoA hydratase/isomerase family protein [Albidovulum sp.]MDE0532901.1 enoyl-CoA hydratase/isomerase family protein [Albidovulum sp.]